MLNVRLLIYFLGTEDLSRFWNSRVSELVYTLFPWADNFTLLGAGCSPDYDLA